MTAESNHPIEEPERPERTPGDPGAPREETSPKAWLAEDEARADTPRAAAGAEYSAGDTEVPPSTARFDQEQPAAPPAKAEQVLQPDEKTPEPAPVTAEGLATAGEGEGSAGLAVAVKKESAPKSDKMDWYILKVQSNREESIREGLLRRVAIAGLDRYFGEVIVPTEKVTEFKGGKKRVTKRKLYPGYLVVQMEINEETWFLVRETPGIGDFTGGAGHPTPMQPHEVARILAKAEEKADETPKLKVGFRIGDRVKINEGTFENFEGEVHHIDEQNGRVTVMINIFSRSTPVELEYWQVEAV